MQQFCHRAFACAIASEHKYPLQKPFPDLAIHAASVFFSIACLISFHFVLFCFFVVF